MWFLVPALSTCSWHKTPCFCTSMKYSASQELCTKFVLYRVLVAVDCTKFYFSSASGATPKMHDDVIKWKHFPCYWTFVPGIHRSPVNSPHKGQWRGALMFSFICVWINDWVNNRKVGDLRRYRVHYDLTVMYEINHTNSLALQYNAARTMIVIGLSIAPYPTPCSFENIAIKIYLIFNSTILLSRSSSENVPTFQRKGSTHSFESNVVIPNRIQLRFPKMCL